MTEYFTNLIKILLYYYYICFLGVDAWTIKNHRGSTLTGLWTL